jgi:hypothetical protein
MAVRRCVAFARGRRGILGANWRETLVLMNYEIVKCGSLVFFENVKCLKCGHALGFLPQLGRLSALDPVGNGQWRPLADGETDRVYRSCENGARHQVCNWLVGTEEENPFCFSCRLNRLIPDLSGPGNLERWRKLELAKHRTIYTIMRLGLPVEGENGRPALRFNFISDVPGGPAAVTGHADGLIVINIAEADDAERERRRVNLHEPYRTLLGHFRHEVAHYYWDRLIANSDLLPGFRKHFGDEREDYGAALAKYYKEGPPADWQTRFVSAYASAHPWEDWAETSAHYFHIMDLVETAASFGVLLRPRHPSAETMTATPWDVFTFEGTFDTILESWFPLTYALNSLNRSMGLQDIYPFVLPEPAIAKLRFIHEVARGNRASRELPADENTVEENRLQSATA